MARSLIDIESFDLSQDVMDDAQVRAMVPHAHEFQLIDGICHLDVETGLIIGYKDWGDDPWWGRGHIPGRPLMPGVLMVEGCAQVCTILMKKREGWPDDSFIGLGGLNDVRFRGQAVPPCRVYFVSQASASTGRRIAKYPAQCFLNGKMIMQMELMGVVL